MIDLACGVGYGARILAEAGHRVTAIDSDAEAIAYAREHYAHRQINYLVDDARILPNLAPHDAAVCFETIEHLEHPLVLLQKLRCAPLLLASVPNEDVFPYRNYRFHYRHYRPNEFKSLLGAAGFRVIEWFGQIGPESEVEKDVSGRTLIVSAQRIALTVVREDDLRLLSQIEFPPAPALAVPDHVAILGLGPSLEEYVRIAKCMGARRKLADEVWGINAVADIIQCDRVFHMDDVRIQEIRAAAKPQSNIAAMLTWLKAHPGPVYTSRPHPDYPGTVAFPLEDVINNLGYAYFNNTAAYAVGYAVHIGVKKISLFGCDFTYAKAHDSEKGRGCVEYWLGFARARGIEIATPVGTSLLDACEADDLRFYGYDTLHVGIDIGAEDHATVTFTERATLPDAKSIEARYDHSQHPNPLIGNGAA